MKTVKKIAAAAMAIVMAVTFMPMLPGVNAEAGAAEGNAKAIEPLPVKTATTAAETGKTAAEKTTAKTASAAAESPSIYTFETDFDALTQKYRRYPKIAFGLDDKEWIVCGKQNNELVLICNPADSYGQTIFADDTGSSYEYSYETSQLDKMLQDMAGSGSTAFSKSEISLMKDVSVTLIGDYSHVSDSKYQITRKLYAPYPNEGTVKIGCGITDSMGDIQLSLSDSQFQGASFWTRAVNKSTVYKYENGSQTSASADDKSNIVPAMHLDLASSTAKPIFVSAAEPAKEGANIASTARTPSSQDTTLTMRYDGGNKVKYKAEYNSGRVTVKSDTIVHDEYLYVQWLENDVNKVKSIKLKDYTTANGGESTYTAEEIGGSGFSITDGVKIWVEKKDDNLTYAKMGTCIMNEGPAVPDLEMSRSTNGEDDGSLSGLDPNEEYEYCLYSSVKVTQDWMDVPKGSSEIKNLCSGNYQIRTKATDKRSAGPARMYRVKDIYDVTIDSDTNKVLMNEKNIDTYSVFSSLSVGISYAKDAVLNTLSKISDVFDAKAVSELISKYAGNSTGYYNTSDTVDKLAGTSEKLNSLSVETDSGTKAIVGEVDSAELKKEWKNVENELSEFQKTCYSGFAESALKNIDSFYSGGMADENKTDEIDSSLLYFYSDEDISQLTGKKNDKASGEEYYKDITNLGEVMLNAAPNGKEKTDIFSLCEGVYSHIYNFNSETFADREELYERIFRFYEKGYAALSTSMAYNISNHKDHLTKLKALQTAGVRAESAGAPEAILKATDTIAKETAKVYGLDSGSYNWAKLEKLHNEQITKEKKALKELNTQYESIKAAYEDAEEYLKTEKQKYSNEKIIKCYRTEAQYSTDLQLCSVNYPYVEAFKSTRVFDFLKVLHHKANPQSSQTGDFDYYYSYKDILDKYKRSEKNEATSLTRLRDLKSIENGAKSRGMSFDEQMGSIFNIVDQESGKSMSFSQFPSNEKYNKTLGYYTNGEHRYRDGETYWVNILLFQRDEYRIFMRVVTYYKGNGEIDDYRPVVKEWESIIEEDKAEKGQIKQNYVRNDLYVIHLNRVNDYGRGGGDGCFMAKGTAKSATNKITWNEVEGADGYDVYYARCGKTMKKVKSTTALKYTKRNLNKKRSYKYRIKAYTNEDGEKQYIAQTPLIHVAGSATAYSNALTVDIDKDYLNLKSGETGKVTGKILKKSSNKPVLWKNHVKSKMRYMSSDETVVTVDSKGNVTAKEAGYAYIYVYATNGAYTGIEVTVE